MKNLFGSTKYWNTVEAWRAWNEVAEKARNNGQSVLVDMLQPNSNAHWKTIDKATKALREELGDG